MYHLVFTLQSVEGCLLLSAYPPLPTWEEAMYAARILTNRFMTYFVLHEDDLEEHGLV